MKTNRNVRGAIPNPICKKLNGGQVRQRVTFMMLIVLNCMGVCGADVSFYTIYKGEKYVQASSGAPTLGSGNPEIHIVQVRSSARVFSARFSTQP